MGQRWLAKRNLVRDDGGERSKNGRGGLVKRSNCRSMRCESCSKLTYLTPGQQMRAAVPKCMSCGGYLVDTIATDQRVGKPLEILKQEKEFMNVCAKCRQPLSKYNNDSICNQCSAAQEEADRLVQKSIRYAQLYDGKKEEA